MVFQTPGGIGLGKNLLYSIEIQWEILIPYHDYTLGMSWLVFAEKPRVRDLVWGCCIDCTWLRFMVDGINCYSNVINEYPLLLKKELKDWSE